jgi:subtilisin family serine protease
MFMYTAMKQRVELIPLETTVKTDQATKSLSVKVQAKEEDDPIGASALVTLASRAFFEIGREGGKAFAAAAPKGPPPTPIREKDTSLLHVVYREIVIRFKHGTPDKTRRSILKQGNFKVRRVNRFFSDQVIVHDPSRKHSGEELLEIANRWSEMEDVVFASPNFVSQYLRHQLPKIRAEQWHLRNTGQGGGKNGEDVNVLQAWKRTTGKGIIVAVIDDGVDVDHPNLKPRIWKNPHTGEKDKVGRDFFLLDDDPGHYNPRPKVFRFPFDDTRYNDIHGTSCAGVIVGAGKNGGPVGVAPGSRVLAIKIFHGNSLARDEQVGEAIRHSATIADILSCSWTGGSADVQQAIEDAGQLGRGGRGSAVFCAAGNEDHSPVGFPASDANAIAVGASTNKAKLASYSNVGPEIQFVAPSDGGSLGIFTTDVAGEGRGYNPGDESLGDAEGLYTNDFGGTSSATPLAAGVGALVLSVNPKLSRTDLRDLLARTADKIGSGYDSKGHSNKFGFGRVNAGKAVEEALAVKQAAKKGLKKAAKA